MASESRFTRTSSLYARPIIYTTIRRERETNEKTRDKLIQKFWPFLFTLKQNVSAVWHQHELLSGVRLTHFMFISYFIFFFVGWSDITPLSISISFICQTSNIKKKIQNIPMNHFGQWTCLMCKKGLTWIMNLNNYSKKYLNSVTSGHVYQNIDEKQTLALCCPSRKKTS